MAAPTTVKVSNGTQTGKAVWDLDNGDLVITLYNLTADTLTPEDLLTGFRFGVSGADYNSLTAASADTVWVGAGGAIDPTKSETDVDLLDPVGDGKASWSIVALTDCFELRFNPDAKHSIIGAPDGDGDYSEANGGISSNGGHNPFADQMATYRISLDNLGSDFDLEFKAFLFGTDFGIVIIPLPASAWLGLGLLGTIGVVQVVRRRRRASLI